VREYTEHLLGKCILGYTVMIIKTCLGAPTDMEGRINISFSPFEDFAKLTPIVNLFKFHKLNGSTGDNHTVIFSMFDHIKGIVELVKVALGGILYYIIMIIILWLKLDPNDLKLFTALIVAVFLAVPYIKKKTGESTPADDRKKRDFFQIRRSFFEQIRGAPRRAAALCFFPVTCLSEAAPVVE
jgi:hypothetical protein